MLKHIKKIENTLYNFFLWPKMTNKYNQKQEEKLRKKSRERYHNLSEELKDKRRKKARKRYQNFPEEEQA